MFDVFISYRRDKGLFIARNLQQALKALGLKVFYDMETLTDGKFNEKLYDALEESRNVIFLMTEGALDRCVNEGDWVRNELEHVISHGVNLVPIAPTGTPIVFPEGLPESLASLKNFEISELNTEKLFDESVSKIARRLKDVVLASERERQENEEAFRSMVHRFKGNDGVIDPDEMKQLMETARELHISPAMRIKIIEQEEQAFVSSAAVSPDILPPVPEASQSFDVFLSYRRGGADADVRMLYDRLTRDGYTVSFDLDNLKQGNFNEELLNRIASCRDFVVLLSKGCFDRTLAGCKREDDWLRIEIATALYNHKNVVTVLLPDFEFPSKLPPDIDAIRHQNGPKYDLYYLDSFYERLEQQFLTKRAAENAAEEVPIAEDEVLQESAAEKARDESLEDIFGDDAASWREEARAAYESVSRFIPWEDLKRLDEAWEEAEAGRAKGDHSLATRRYMDVMEFVPKLRPCASAFATRLVGDGIDPHRRTWFKEALARAQSGDAQYQYGVGMLYAEGVGVEKDASAAFRWFERAAAAGLVPALSAVGAAYATGEGVEVDYKAARRFLSRAARRNDARALERIGYLYLNGFGVRRNYTAAVSHYRKAAGFGNSAAMVALGRMLEEGVGIERDLAKAAVWYRAAAANGSAPAQRHLAAMLFEGRGLEKDVDEAVKLARLAATQGDADAIALLGHAYENGWGVTADGAKARELYTRADQLGSALARTYLAQLEAEAQYRLGLASLKNEKGHAPDFVVARTWFEKAAAQEHAVAMDILGFLNQRGLGGALDIARARAWYEKAAEKGSLAAEVGLGQLYFRGNDGIPRDFVKARACFLQAARNWRQADDESRWRVLYAFFYLGRIYLEGLGVTADPMLGRRFLLLGASNGNLACLHKLAINYEKGREGFQKNAAQQKNWYALCARQVTEGSLNPMDDLAMRIAGMLYKFGDGVPRDSEKSREWLERAAELGNVQSLADMGMMYRKGRGVARDMARALSYYQAAADRGSDTAQNALSWIYYTAEGVARDTEKAYTWALKAAENGNAGAMETLYRMYRDGEGTHQDEAEALRWLRAGEEKGSAAAASALGYCYETGTLGVAQDAAKARALYQKAAEKHDTMGLYLLGLARMGGIGGVKDEAHALASLVEAVREADPDLHYDDRARVELERLFYGADDFKGCVARWDRISHEDTVRALYHLGFSYLHGKVLAPNNARAVQCLTVAAEGDHKEAQNTLGWMYYQGRRVPHDLAKAFYWTKKAVDNGNSNGMETLYRMYREGAGVPANAAEARAWLERAASGEEASQTAVASLGECYERGLLGFKKDEERAFQLYYGAAQRGNVHAMYARGVCHMKGIGTLVDPRRALEWLTKAAEMPDEDLFFDEAAMQLLAKADKPHAANWRVRYEKLHAERAAKGYYV